MTVLLFFKTGIQRWILWRIVNMTLCKGESRSAVYGTLAVDGVFDGVMELSDSEYSVERADRYIRDAPFPSVMYRHSDITTSQLVNSTVCLSDILHVQRTATQQQASALRQQPFSPYDQVRQWL